jgi:cytochrome subunit of sulfide dehydrogenase
MTGNIHALGLLAAAAFLCLAPAPGARAADFNTVIANCTKADCHNKDGASAKPDTPIIGGMSAIYLAEQVAACKKKQRKCPDGMFDVVKDLGDADIKQVTDYLAKQKFVRASQAADAALAAKGQQIHHQNCERCHSNNGSLADDDAGILAGQWTPYLKEQLAAVGSDTRKVDPKMKAVVDQLEAASIDALLNFYASLK